MHTLCEIVMDTPNSSDNYGHWMRLRIVSYVWHLHIPKIIILSYRIGVDMQHE